MSFEETVARAAPPPERADAGVFEPVATEAGSLARRREKAVQAFGSFDHLAAHAESLGLSPDAWLGRLGDVRLAGAPPDWACAFRAIFERLTDGALPFAEVRRWAGAEVRRAWPASLPHGPEVLDGPLDYLAGRVGQALQPTWRVEAALGLRRSWPERFRRSPGLAYALGRVMADWLAAFAEIGARTAGDRALLSRRYFDRADPGPLLRIDAGLGDPHAGGRSVAILHFERGAVVYKPKDLRVAKVVAEIADRIGDRAGDRADDRTGNNVRLASPDPLIRDGYAWERVHHTAPIADPGEADAFFAALGGWLAVLQALGATDFWFDNLIADGPIPRFVDFETAVQPPIGWPDGLRALSPEGMARIEAAPVRVGILPLMFPTRDGEDPTDIGCLGRPGEHRTPVPDIAGRGLLSWREERFAPRYAEGGVADAADHFDALEDGYLRVVGSLADPSLRSHVIETLRRTADATVRSIQIDTWTSYRISQSSCAPRHLADGVWRELALHAALPVRGDVGGALREAAVRDLRRLDIPLFQTRLGSRDLCGIEGERHRAFFERDAIAGARERLERLAVTTEDEHVAWLRSGFALRFDNPARRRTTATSMVPARAADLLDWADEIASGVARHAVGDAHGAPTWIGLMHDVFTGCRFLGPLGFDILSGHAGLALALRELARTLERSDLATLAAETLHGAGRGVVAHPRAALAAGAGYAVGAGGLVAALAEDEASRSLAVEVWGLASAAEVWMRSGGDFVSGLAGWRVAAEALGEAVPSRHGPGRPYAPSARPRLAVWLDPANAVSLCADRRAAARLRRDRDRHGSWLAAGWLDDRHNLSGIDGLPALAVRFARLAAGAPA